METPNQISLDYKENPELREAFAGKKVGDKTKITVELQINDLNDERIVGSIESVETDEPETPSVELEEETTEPDSESPVMLVMSSGKRSDVAPRKDKKENDAG